MKCSKFILLCFTVLLCFMLVGCDEADKVKKEELPSLIEKVSSDTQKAKEEKNVKLARELWGTISEYSVKADEYGDKELAEALSYLASSYTKLIEYCESEDKNQLKKFEEEFKKAVKKFETFKNDEMTEVEEKNNTPGELPVCYF